MVSQSTKRRVLAGVLGLLLFASVVGANAAIAADRTMLDADYVKDGLAEEGAYEAMADDLIEGVADDAQGSAELEDAPMEAPPVEELAGEVLTPEYVRDQMEDNVDRVYAYLHGDSDDLTIAFDTRPIQAGLADQAETWVREADLADFDADAAELAESEAAFDQARTEFEEAQLARIQAETEEEYSEPELRAIYDDRRPAIRDRLAEEVESEVAGYGLPSAVQDATVALGTARVDAMVAADASYEDYVADTEAAQEQLAVAWGDEVETRLGEEMGDQQVIAEGEDATGGPMEIARLAFGVLDVLVYVLPVAALGLAGLVTYVLPTRSAALLRVGTTAVLAGAGSIVASVVGRSVLPAPEGAGGLGDAGIAIVGDALSTYGTQSAALLGVGVVLVGAGFAVRRGLLPIQDRPGGAADDGAATEAPAGGTETPGGTAETPGGTATTGGVTESPDDEPVVDGGGEVATSTADRTADRPAADDPAHAPAGDAADDPGDDAGAVETSTTDDGSGGDETDDDPAPHDESASRGSSGDGGPDDSA